MPRFGDVQAIESDRQTVAACIGSGFIGYYLAAILDFEALTYKNLLLRVQDTLEKSPATRM